MAAIITANGPAEDILHARYEKSATAMLAVARILERDRPLDGGESEFLHLVGLVQDAGPEAFTRVWRDPFAYWWSRLAYQIVASNFREEARPPFLQAYCDAIGEQDNLRALKHHLDEFKRISLGVALVSGANLTLREPLTREGPLAIPGTRLSTAAGRISLAGVKDGMLIGPDGLPVVTGECPVAEAAGLDWRLQAAAFRLPGIGFEVPDVSLDASWQQELVGVTAEAFEIIHRMRPELHPAFDAVARVIGFKPLDSAQYTNLTHSELPGSFMCSVYMNPYDLADTLIHEFHHNLLYAIEEGSPFFKPGTEAVTAFYSAWRSDIRDLHGILHAVYVYIASTAYWLAVHRSGEGTGELAEYLRDRLLRYPLQLSIGVAVLEDCAEFTEHGQRLFAEIKDACRAIEAEVAAIGLPQDAPAIACSEQGAFEFIRDRAGTPMSVRQTVRHHLDAYDTGGTGHRAVDSHAIAL